MFEVKAKDKALVITSLATRTYAVNGAAGNFDVEVWTKQGTMVGFEYSSESWTKIADVPFTSDPWAMLQIPEFETPVPIAAGATQSFYVTHKNGGKAIWTGGDPTRNTLADEDDSLQLFHGYYNVHPFGANGAGTWNGVLTYMKDNGVVATTPAPSPGPTNQPTPGPSHSPTMSPTTASPTANPSKAPSPGPTNQPTPGPSYSPTSINIYTSTQLRATATVTLSVTVDVDAMSNEQLSAFGAAFSEAMGEFLTSSDEIGDGVSVDVIVISINDRLLTRRKLENAIDVVLGVTFVTQCDEGCEALTAETTLAETAGNVTSDIATEEGLQSITTAVKSTLEDSSIDGVSTLTITGAESTPIEVTTVSPTLAIKSWALELTSVDSNFTKDSGDEIILRYKIGAGRKFKFSVLKKGCKEAVDTAVITPSNSTSLNEDDLSLETLSVFLDVEKNTIVGSNIWDSSKEVVELCVRVELLSSISGNVVKKLEHDFGIELLFSNTFETADEAQFGQIILGSNQTDAQVNDYIEACTCDSKESFECNQNVLGRDDFLNVCIKSAAEEMEINYLDSLKMVQEDKTLSIVRDRDLVDGSISSKSKVALKNGVHVASVIPTSFFSYESSSTATVSGVVFLKLSGSRRRLAVEIDDSSSTATHARVLQGAAGDQESAFALEVQLKKNELGVDAESNGAFYTYTFMTRFVGVTMTAVVVVAIMIW